MEIAKPEETENSEEIVVRRIKGSEVEQVSQLITVAFDRESRFTGRDVQRLRRMARLYRLISGLIFFFDILQIDFETILVAVWGEKVVGEIHVVPHGKGIWSLDSAAVDAQFRGRGIFKNLMKEAIRYIVLRRGERIVTSFWTSNIASAKVTGELEFEVFEERSILHLEMDENALFDIKSAVSVKALQKKDIQQVYEICKKCDPKRMETYKLTPEDVFESFTGRLRKEIANVHSKRWVLLREGKVVGYASFTYTSPKRAGNIESFYILPSKDSSELASVLLGHVLNFLLKRNMRRVLVSLNEESSEIIEVFQRYGFKHVAFVYELVKKLKQ